MRLAPRQRLGDLVSTIDGPFCYAYIWRWHRWYVGATQYYPCTGSTNELTLLGIQTLLLSSTILKNFRHLPHFLSYQRIYSFQRDLGYVLPPCLCTKPLMFWACPLAGTPLCLCDWFIERNTKPHKKLIEVKNRNGWVGQVKEMRHWFFFLFCS